MYWELLKKERKMLLIDKYAYTNNLRDFSPNAKVLIGIGGILFSRILNNYYFDFLTIICMVALVIFAAKVPCKNYFKMLLIPASFLIISIVTIIFTFNDLDYLWHINIGRWTLGFTSPSLKKGLKLFTTVLASLTSMYFIILTTPIIDLIRALNKIKCPKLLIELMVLIYRSIFMFIEEANNIYLAQTMRFGYENNKTSLKSISLLIRNLLTRMFIKGNEMNTSLECKLYDGEFKLGD